MVDLVDIGLMNASEATGRRRLNDTMRQLSDAIRTGFSVHLQTTSVSGLADHVTVTSLRRCDHDVAPGGCSNGSLVAERLRPPAAPPRPRALMTSSNDSVSVTSSSSSACRTVVCADLAVVIVSSCFLSLMYYLTLRLQCFSQQTTNILQSAADYPPRN